MIRPPVLRLPLLISVFVCTSASAATTPAASTITAATVYSDRAVVTRVARVELTAGQNEITFPGLPARILDNSIQVSGRGVAATLLDVNARTLHADTTTDLRVKTLEDELIALQRQDRTLRDQLGVLGEQTALLAKIENVTTQPAPRDSAAAPRPTIDDWQKLLAFSANTTARLASERQALDEQREALDRKISALKAQLKELRGQLAARHATKTVTARFTAEQAGPLDITLAYALPGAAWSPAYDARLRSEERAVELTYSGIVRNATGEDWTDIALTLSTARPNLGGGAPELRPWIVDVLQNPVRPEPSAATLGGAGSPKLSQTFINSMALDVAPFTLQPAADSALAVAALDNAATSASFKIPAAATIPSDNSAQKLGIATVKLAAHLQYQATPKQLEAAFLSAYATNTTEYPFIAGTLSAFLDNTFVATSRLKTVMPGEKFQLDLGADEGVAFKRRLVNRFTETTGFTNKTRRITYDFLITITNNKPTAERVVFKDVLPVSRDEKITVKLLAPAEKDVGTLDKPGREVTREEDGKLVWRLDLKPGEKREIPFTFTIDHPVDLTITGVE